MTPEEKQELFKETMTVLIHHVTVQCQAATKTIIENKKLGNIWKGHDDAIRGMAAQTFKAVLKDEILGMENLLKTANKK